MDTSHFKQDDYRKEFSYMIVTTISVIIISSLAKSRFSELRNYLSSVS